MISQKALREKQAKENAVLEIEFTGHEVTVGHSHLEFQFKGSTVMYFYRKGWATGKTIKDGRGLNKLLNQLNE